MELQLKLRYMLLRVLRNGEVVAFDHKIKDFIIMKFDEWKTHSGDALIEKGE